jgi:hypothetical protein
MNTARSGMLSFVIGMSCMACAAQNAAIPFKQIERDAQLSARLNTPSGNDSGESRSFEMPAEISSSSGAAFARPVYKRERTLSTSFFLMNGLHLGAAMLDVGMTQHCLADHHCREGNPMMPSSLSGQLSVDFGMVGFGTFISYKLKKQESKVWWLSPMMGIAAHAAGAASGFINR